MAIFLFSVRLGWLPSGGIMTEADGSLPDRLRHLVAPMLVLALRELLPNAIAPIVVAATLNIANAILLESYISLLGYGIQPPVASWGNSDVRNALQQRENTCKRQTL
jgi:hypothetical protein